VQIMIGNRRGIYPGSCLLSMMVLNPTHLAAQSVLILMVLPVTPACRYGISLMRARGPNISIAFAL
jgi:hypothetical protein